MGYFWGKDFSQRCPNLNFIVSNTTGHPHIDVKEAQKANIEVITLKGDHEFLDRITPTAEHTIGLMLSLLRGYPRAFQAPLIANWNRRNHGGLGMLSRMTIGIVGLEDLAKKLQTSVWHSARKFNILTLLPLVCLHSIKDVTH